MIKFVTIARWLRRGDRNAGFTAWLFHGNLTAVPAAWSRRSNIKRTLFITLLAVLGGLLLLLSLVLVAYLVLSLYAAGA